MADYARPPGLPEMRAAYESARWNKARRPRTGNVPCPTWSYPGLVDIEVQPTPLRVSIDPLGEDQLIEYKRLVGFDGWLSTGQITIEWYVNDTLVQSGHVIAGDENELILAVPIIWKTGKHWVRPAFNVAPTLACVGLSMVAIIETIQL